MTRDDAREEAGLAASVLPSLEILEKIMRYETKLERQFSGEIDCLGDFAESASSEATAGW